MFPTKGGVCHFRTIQPNTWPGGTDKGCRDMGPRVSTYFHTLAIHFNLQCTGPTGRIGQPTPPPHIHPGWHRQRGRDNEREGRGKGGKTQNQQHKRRDKPGALQSRAYEWPSKSRMFLAEAVLGVLTTPTIRPNPWSNGRNMIALPSKHRQKLPSPQHVVCVAYILCSVLIHWRLAN